MSPPKLPDGLPAPGQAHLWWCPLELPADDLSKLIRLLEPGERDRANASPSGRRLVSSRGQLRLVLGHYLQLPARDIRFRYGPHGKPELAAPCPPELRFNVSHSGELAVCAVTVGQEVGVDIERVRPLGYPGGLAKRVFSPGEYAAFQRIPKDRAHLGFLRFWVRKEAVLKASGTGISAGRLGATDTSSPSDGDRLASDPLAGVVPLRPQAVSRFPIPASIGGVSLAELRVASEYLAACVLESGTSATGTAFFRAPALFPGITKGMERRQ